FQISDNTKLLLVLGPSETIKDDEAEYILQWVARGNTLFLADKSGFDGNKLFRLLGVEFDSLEVLTSRAALTQPLMDTTSGEVEVQPFNTMNFQHADFVTYAEAETKPILARIVHGAGAVWISTAPDVFTNQNLHDEDNAK